MDGRGKAEASTAAAAPATQVASGAGALACAEPQGLVALPVAGATTAEPGGADIGALAAATDVAEKDLRAGLVKLLAGRDLDATTVKGLRTELAEHLGLPVGGLDDRKEQVSALATAVIAAICPRHSAPHAADEASGEERTSAVKANYLVTFAHPRQEHADCGVPLRPPGEFTHQGIVDAVLEALHAQQGAKYSALRFDLMAVFRERHRSGEAHYHVAIRGSRCFRFGPLKKLLLAQSGLASHWSTSHDCYASCVGYGYVPTPAKPMAELDPTPLLWAHSGSHPPLAEASRKPMTADAVSKRREQGRLRRAEEGKGEQRFQEVDLWPIVVNERILATTNAGARVVEYAKRCGGPSMVSFCFQNEHRLADIVAKCWRFENAEECVKNDGKPREAFLREALEKPCCCGGRWTSAALQLFDKNGLDPARWCSAVLTSLQQGRQKGSLVCHVGASGDEGKSFLFGPLPEVFGEGQIFSPVKSGFPLVGLDRCRVVLLDDWRFGEDILSYNVQLLWFEGKPIIIARPQNQSTGHLRYQDDAPIFITTLEANLDKVHKGLLPGDVAMMKKRLIVFRFVAKLENPDRTIRACARCFADFVLTHAGAAGEAPTSDPLAADTGAKRSAPGSSGDTPPVKTRKDWSVQDVCSWLDSLSLGHVAQRFRDNGVDGAFLSDLAEEELMAELGLTKLQAKKVMTRWR